MKRALMVSWLFPPHGSIGAKRAWRFARHLPGHGWAPTVLCRRRPPASVHDPSDWSLPPEVTVSATYDAAWISALGSAGSTPANASMAEPSIARPLSARLSERWDRFVDAVVPMETAIIHAPHAEREVDRLLPFHDVLWTTSYPYHSHVIGMRMARKHRRPWVADLRDPWTPNWVHRRKFAFARAVEARCERDLFDRADAVVVTTETLAAMERARFAVHASKIHCVHNAFDAALAPSAPPRNLPQRWVHFGNVYGPWTLATVFRAMAARPGAVVLENYGKLGDGDRALVRSLGLEGAVRVSGPIPYDRGLEVLRGADALVLAAWNHPDAGLYLQGKLYDYLAVGRPIVAESSQPELSSILQRTGAGVTIAPGSVDSMVDVIDRLARDGSVSERSRDDEAVSYYSAAQAAGRLAAIFAKVGAS